MAAYAPLGEEGIVAIQARDKARTRITGSQIGANHLVRTRSDRALDSK